MRTRSIAFDAAAEDLDVELITGRQQADRKPFERSRTARSPKRRVNRSAGASVPLGMSARRNRRFAW